MRSHYVVCAIVATSIVIAACGSSPTSPTTPTSTPTSVSWSTTITPSGTASRTFTASESGTVTVTLAATAVPLGFGVGVPRAGTAGCRLSSSRVDVAGAAMSVTVEKGDYCVQVYDVGNLSAQSTFTLTVVYP